MSFGAPQWFWALLGLPLLILLFGRAERRSSQRLHAFVAPRLVPELTGKVDRMRRYLRFALQLAALALAIVSLAQPRWGYSFEEARRKGIDLLLAVDTSRSMLSNDVQPNRLERVKLAMQDLINQLQGDRVGLIAFAGRAFIQAPLTIDYGAVVDAINDLSTDTIPEGGTNISEAISLAIKTYGKSATGNRALVIFTDGEELSGDALKTAKAATDAGVRIFTVGVGTPQGSLIPIRAEDAQNAFVKDAQGQVVKSKLDEKRLRDIAETAGGFYLHLENGPRTMQQLVAKGVSKMKAADIDVRLARRPIERYEWPLGLAVLALGLSVMIGERKRIRRMARVPSRGPTMATAATALILLTLPRTYGSAPGLDAYRGGKFDDAYAKFQETLKAHPQNSASDKLNFDSGAAAYKMKEYGKALESFSQALLSPDQGLQSKSHYNLGNTLYEGGESEKSDGKKLTNWTNALQHYEETLKLDPGNKEAKENYEFVKKKIDELKNKQSQPSPTPSPTPKQDKKDEQKKSDQKDQSQQQQKQEQQQQSSGQNQQQQQQKSQGDSGADQDKKEQNGKDQSQSKDQTPKDPKDQSPKAGETPSPTRGSNEPSATPSASPSSSSGQDKKEGAPDEPPPSPSPSDSGSGQPSPSPSSSSPAGGRQGSGQNTSPSPAPNSSPPKKLSGDIKPSDNQDSEKPPTEAEAEELEPEKDGQMSERQARALLESMRDEEARVQLDERRAARRVYKDW